MSKHSASAIINVPEIEKPTDSDAGQLPADIGNRVTVWSGTLAGIAALVGGAALTGASHYAATGKALKDEGFDPKLRRLAVPIAARALAVTSLVTVVAGGGLLMFMQQLLQPRNAADVGTFQDAIALMRQQREAVQTEISRRKYDDSTRHTDDDKTIE